MAKSVTKTRATEDTLGAVARGDRPVVETLAQMQIDTFARPESQDPAYAVGNGDLSVHEVALDPKERLAYVSYYGLGFRVLEYGSRGLKEVGAFVDEGGSNFWGVEVHRIDDVGDHRAAERHDDLRPGLLHQTVHHLGGSLQDDRPHPRHLVAPRHAREAHGADGGAAVP